MAISGYLYYYQVNRKREGQEFGSFAKSKFRRLIIPSVLFSAAYFAIFYEYKSVADAVYVILNGAGHMWFLPMLFWCYLGGWIIVKTERKDAVILLVLVLLVLLSFVPFPFRINSAMYYLLFFYQGMLIRKYHHFISAMGIKRIIALWVCFILLFMLSQAIVSHLPQSDAIASKLLRFETITILNVLCSSIAVLAAFSVAERLTRVYTFSEKAIQLSGYCFGVYLFQQFILQGLYYRTNLPEIAGPYLLPWISMVITLILSILFTHIMLKTKIGKTLIG